MAEPDAYTVWVIDSLLQESEEMEADFTGWLEREAPRWRELGRDEMWIRLRMEMAQAMRKLNRLMKAQGLSVDERRQAMLAGFAGMPMSPAASPVTPPEEIQHAVEVLGAEIGATIFEVSPVLSREQFRVRVDFLIQHQFGESFLRERSARVQFAHDALATYATQEYKRLGGVWREPPGHGKRRRHRSRRHL